MLNVTPYKEYFLKLATAHNVLRHDPLMPGRTAFTFFSQEEVIADALRSEIGEGACLHLHMYEWRMTDNGAYDQRSSCQAAFMVTQQADIHDTAAIEQAYAVTESIVNDMISRMQRDYHSDHCSCPFGIAEWEKLECTPVGPIWQNRFGWYVTWPFVMKRDSRTPDEFAAAAKLAFTDLKIFEKQFENEFE